MKTTFNRSQVRVLLSNDLHNFALKVLRELGLDGIALERFSSKEIEEILGGLAEVQGQQTIKNIALEEDKDNG